MKPRNLQALRRTGRLLTAGFVSAALLAGATATIASATPKPGAARTIRLSADDRRQLVRLYAAYRRIPLSDIARVTPAQGKAARASNGEEWAIEGFLPSRTAPASVSVNFQDGNGSGLFTRLPGQKWKMIGFGGAELGCVTGIPAAVLRSWGYGSCPAPAPIPKGTHGSGQVFAATAGVGQQIATLANTYAAIPVMDNPADYAFTGPNCNPFTYFENAGPSTANSACGIDSTFLIQDYDET